jgi:hypothetical protein
LEEGDNMDYNAPIDLIGPLHKFLKGLMPAPQVGPPPANASEGYEMFNEPGPPPRPPASVKKFHDTLPKDPNAPQSRDVTAEARGGYDPLKYEKMWFDTIFQAPWRGFSTFGEGTQTDAPEAPLQITTPPSAEEDIYNPPMEAPPDVGEAISPPMPPTPQQVPKGLVSNNEAIRTALLQTGLNMLVPQWGGPLAQFGQAAGGGAEAVGRLGASRQAQSESGLDLQLKNAQIQATNALTTARGESAETSRVKRLKGASDGSTQYERMVKDLNLGPKGSAYFKEAIKSLSEEDILGVDDRTPLQKFEDILSESRALDGEGEGAPPAGGAADFAPAGEEVEGRDGIMFRSKGGPRSDPATWEKVE